MRANVSEGIVIAHSYCAGGSSATSSLKNPSKLKKSPFQKIHKGSRNSEGGLRPKGVMGPLRTLCQNLWVRYFSIDSGVQTVLIEVFRLINETGATLFKKLETVWTKYGIRDKIMCLSADNCKTNFVGSSLESI